MRRGSIPCDQALPQLEGTGGNEWVDWLASAEGKTKSGFLTLLSRSKRSRSVPLRRGALPRDRRRREHSLQAAGEGRAGQGGGKVQPPRGKSQGEGETSGRAGEASGGVNGKALPACVRAREGIAWESDLKVRFKDRPPYSGETNMNPRGFQIPAVDDEDFVVWMRCSHLPHFYKIYRQILDRGLKKGEFLHLTVLDTFPTDIWGGQKWVVLTTLTWTGSSDWVLVGAHFLMAILCFLAGLFFFINNQAGRLKTQSDNYAVLEMQSMIPSGPSRAASFRDVATPPTLSRPVSAVHNSRKLEISDQKLDVSSHSLQH
eukprot:g74519.t1